MARMSDELIDAIVQGARRVDFDPEDALFMVNSFARRRRRATDSSAEEAQRFGGIVLCFIFDPVKGRNTAYVEAMRGIREDYRGIFLDLTLQDAFEENLSKEFVIAESVQHAVEMGAHALFEPRLAARGSY
ncbi:MAG TPA: hypothetical protein VFS13_00980 [Steroidobacteraceae bacterium]|nr:hypothetical protein [Steroidobacteraceae bacterium]